jgi:transcriptional regulator with XRE-family HTH domain
MSIGANIQAWRLTRGLSIAALAEKTGLEPSSLDAIETGQLDPPASTLTRLASAFGVPPSWLYGEPRHFDLLTGDPDGDGTDLPPDAIDPVIERIVLGHRQAPDLYVLLAALIQSGDPKLLRAAEVNLRSLVKQSKHATVPWQTRPPGHFEPPSD